MRSDLRECWSDQFELPCVSVEACDYAHPDSVIQLCEQIGAYRDIDPEGREYCAELCGEQRDVGPELWTESALRRSCGKKRSNDNERR